MTWIQSCVQQEEVLGSRFMYRYSRRSMYYDYQNNSSVFGMSTRVTRVTSRTARVALVRMHRRSDLLDYSNPHFTEGYEDSRWRKDENKYKLSQKDDKQSVNDVNFMLFVPNYTFVSPQTPFVFV